MTPVPKNLSPTQVRNWRRAISRHQSPYLAAQSAKGAQVVYFDGATATNAKPKNTLDRHIRNPDDNS